MSASAIWISGARALIKSHLLSKTLLNNQKLTQSARKFSVSNIRNMKFVQFIYKNNPKDIRVGYLEGEQFVVDLNRTNASIPNTMLDLLKCGVADTFAKSTVCCPETVPLSSVTLVAPIYGVDKVLCVALNYADHCKEQNKQQPAVPVIFSKFASTIIGPDEPVKIRTGTSEKVDWEVELAVVIGKKAVNVKEINALNYVFGYTVAQDITARDWQKEKNGGQFLLGKSQDTFCPIGPCIVSKDEIEDPQSLNIKCSVNGVEKQTSNTNQLIHSIPKIIERISSVMTLLPGDLILTGTPGGVGVHRSPPEFLKPGDVISSEIQNIGSFEVKVAAF